jgi:hypothetical protein
MEYYHYVLSKCNRSHPEIACVAVEERIPTRSQTDGAFVCAFERQP